MRLMIAHRDLLWGQDESSEVDQLVAGMLELDAAMRPDVLATDGRDLYSVELASGSVRYTRRERLAGGHLRDADVVWVLVPLHLRTLLTAVRSRLRGARVVLSPMVMLSAEFAMGRWFGHGRSPRWVKPMAVRLGRTIWRVVADEFMCVSWHEVRDSSLPPTRAVVAPWPRPLSGLGSVADLEAFVLHREDDATARPVAFVSRWDPHRKGIDRLARWLSSCADRLPHPAAVLYAPKPPVPPTQLTDLVDRGLLLWDPHIRGAQLAAALRECRGVMLLSRYDGQPRVLREAACLGLPTLSTPASHFAEPVAVLQKGLLVDGDDTAAVQAGFEGLAGADRSSRTARRLFDRAQVAAFVVRALADVAAGRPVSARDYYDATAVSRWRENDGG